MESAVSEIAVGLESAVGAAEPSSVHNKETTLPISTEFGGVGDIDDPAYWSQNKYRTERFREHRPETKAGIALYRESDEVDGTNFMEDFGKCQSEVRLWRSDETGKLEAHGTSCRLPFCPVCSRKRANSIRHRLKRGLLPYLKAGRLRSLCLTLKHTGLNEDIGRIQKGWEKLCRKKFWRGLVGGSDWFLQCEPVDGGKEWHVHRHILLIGDYVPQKWISKTWEKITGDSFDVYIQEIRTERGLDLAVEDVARYVARPANILNIDPEYRLDLLRAMRRRRLCGKTGDGRGVSFATTDPNEPKRSGHYVGDFETLIHLAVCGNEAAAVLLYCFRQAEPSPPGLSCQSVDDFIDDKFLGLSEAEPDEWVHRERSPPGENLFDYEGDVSDENAPW